MSNNRFSLWGRRPAEPETGDEAPPVALSDRHVIWLPKFRLAYLRVPKAANSSIRTRLATTYDIPSPSGLAPNKDRFWSTQAPDTARSLTTAEFQTMPQRLGTWAFSYVRNPAMRLYSCWNNKVVENGGELSAAFQAMGVERSMDFHAFACCVAEYDDADSDIHVRSQVSILVHDDTLVPDFVGRVETANRDWLHVRQETRMRTGIDIGKLPTKNVRLAADLKPEDVISRRTEDIIRARYAADYALFYPRAKHVPRVDDEDAAARR